MSNLTRGWTRQSQLEIIAQCMRWLEDLEHIAVLEIHAETTYRPSLMETAFRDYVERGLREARLLLCDGTGWPIILRHGLLKAERQVLTLRILAEAAADARDLLRERYGIGATQAQASI